MCVYACVRVCVYPGDHEAAISLWLEWQLADREVVDSMLSYCCCLLEQETLLTLFQSTQLY